MKQPAHLYVINALMNVRSLCRTVYKQVPAAAYAERAPPPPPQFPGLDDWGPALPASSSRAPPVSASNSRNARVAAAMAAVGRGTRDGGGNGSGGGGGDGGSRGDAATLKGPESMTQDELRAANKALVERMREMLGTSHVYRCCIAPLTQGVRRAWYDGPRQTWSPRALFEIEST